jgi:hypothetical protein
LMPVDLVNIANISSNGSGYLSLQTGPSGSIVERMRIDSQGRVGIGTANPQYALNVVGDGVFTDAVVSATYVTAPTLAAGLSVVAGSAIAANIVIQPNYITFNGFDGTGRWTWVMSDAELGGNTGSNLRLVRGDDLGNMISAQAAITVSRDTGNVGINNLNATGSINVSGDIACLGYIFAGNSIYSPIVRGDAYIQAGPNGAPHILINQNAAFFNTSLNGLGRWMLGVAATPETGGDFGSDLFIARANDLGYIDSRFYIQRGTGYVGIGNLATPACQLDVLGDIHASGGGNISTDTGRIGIGIATPASELDVVGSAFIRTSIGIGAPPLGAAYPVSIFGVSPVWGLMINTHGAAGGGLAIIEASPASNASIALLNDSNVLGYIQMGGSSNPYWFMRDALIIYSSKSSIILTVPDPVIVNTQYYLVFEPGGHLGVNKLDPEHSVDVYGSIRFDTDLIATNLPGVDPGPGSKKFWFDPTDGNRVKYSP